MIYNFRRYLYCRVQKVSNFLQRFGFSSLYFLPTEEFCKEVFRYFNSKFDFFAIFFKKIILIDQIFCTL